MPHHSQATLDMLEMVVRMGKVVLLDGDKPASKKKALESILKARERGFKVFPCCPGAWGAPDGRCPGF